MFNKLRKAFGFETEDEDELIADAPEAVAPSLPDSPSLNIPAEEPSVNTDRIFAHVVEIFDNALPVFLKAGVNPEAQRRYLYETLDADIKAHLDSLADQAQELCESRWRADKNALNEKLRQVEKRSKDLEDKKLELTQKQLSADRQKRALSERVHELERELSKIAADREQYDLENKSLINKLKVAGVFEKENEELREEISRVQSELLRLRKGAPQTDTAETTAAADNETREQLEKAKAQLEEVTKQLEDARKEIDNAKQREGEAAKSFDELQNQIVSLKRTNKRLEKEKAETPGAEEIKTLRMQVAEADELKAQLEAIELQIGQFQEVKNKKDQHIASLKEELATVRRELALANNALAQAQRQPDVSSPQNDKNKATDEAPTSKTRRDNRGRRPGSRRERPDRRNDKVAETPIDDILSDTDWLVTPREKDSRNHKHDRKDNTRKDNDSQLSLF